MSNKQSFIQKMISKISPTIKTASNSLKKYDVIVVGSNLGGLFTKNFSHFNKGENTVMCAYD